LKPRSIDGTDIFHFFAKNFACHPPPPKKNLALRQVRSRVKNASTWSPLSSEKPFRDGLRPPGSVALGFVAGPQSGSHASIYVPEPR
jgi:hypothetical protein